MENGSGLSAGDILALTKGSNNDLMGGVGFWWVIVFLIVAGMFNGNGFGFGNNVANDGLLNEEFIKRDIFSTNQNVSSTGCQTQRDVLDTKYGLGTEVLTNRYNLGTEIMQNRFNCSQNACNTQKEVMQSRYDNAIGQANLQKDMLLGQASAQRDLMLGNKDIQAQMAQCCCDLKTAIHAEGESTRALITENTIQDLRDRLTLANNAITSQTIADSVIGAVRPYPVPAYPVSSPYGTATTYPYGYGVSSVI